MRVRYFQVDAFASALFRGNPAGVCPLERWLPDNLLQAIAAENNQAETAFFVPEGDRFHLRWFTPEVEIDLCGHATLAAAHVLREELGFQGNIIGFRSQGGDLAVRLKPMEKAEGETSSEGDPYLELDFPARPGRRVPAPALLEQGLRSRPREVLRSRDYMAVFEDARQVAAIEPDFALLARLDSLGIIVTAPGGPGDFVSRFFAPAAGVDEDPVTGSAHCTLIPYWAERLGRTQLSARQISRRGGELECRLDRDRVGIAGRCCTYLRGELDIPDPGSWSEPRRI